MARSRARNVTLETSIVSVLRASLIEHIVANPGLTMNDVADLEHALRQLPTSLTVRELREAAAGPPPARKRGDAKRPSSRPAAGDDLDRTARSKAVLETALRLARSAYGIQDARERLMIRLLAEGLSDKEIEAKARWSRSTIRRILLELYEKLDVGTRTGIVRTVYELLLTLEGPPPR